MAIVKIITNQQYFILCKSILYSTQNYYQMAKRNNRTSNSTSSKLQYLLDDQSNIDVDEQQTKQHYIPKWQQTSVKFITDIQKLHKKAFKKSLKVKINELRESQANISGFESQDSEVIKRKKDKKNQEEWISYNGQKIKTNSPLTKLHGPVEIIHSDGSYFNGYYQKGQRVQGYAKFNNGFQYNGQFAKEQFKGYGTLQFPSGKKISGYWIGSSIEGSARIDYPQGQIYYGQVKNFKKEGFGHFFLANNRKYIGCFKDGWINGKGSYYINEKLEAQGFWKDGTLIEHTSNSAQCSVELQLQLCNNDNYQNQTLNTSSLVKYDYPETQNSINLNLSQQLI